MATEDDDYDVEADEPDQYEGEYNPSDSHQY
jgi:hypothetical protein